MKKVLLLTSILLVSFSLITYAANKTIVVSDKLSDEESNYEALTSEPAFQKIYNYARKVSDLYSKIGPGLPLNAGIDRLLEADEGNCAQHAYLFARYVAQAGYEYNIFGLYHFSGLNHILVDVKYKGHTFAFDPTNGIYYDSSVRQILTDPTLVKTKFGQPKKDSAIYTTSYFFIGINKVEINRNLNYAEPNLLLQQDNYEVESSDLFLPPNDLSGAIDDTTETYLAGIAPLPNGFTIKFDNQVDFYRIYLKWYSPQDYATDFTISYGPDEKHLKELTHVKSYKINDFSDYQFISPVNLKGKVIQFKFNKTAGQNRILLETIGLYH